jgi:glycosyltransferase involved in cell wall biosynthesis
MKFLKRNKKNQGRINVAMLVNPTPDTVTWIPRIQKDVNSISGAADKTFLISSNLDDLDYRPQNFEYVDLKIRLHFVRDFSPKLFSLILWILKQIVIEIRMAYEIVKRFNSIDIVFCYLGLHYQIPILVSKLLGKKVVSSAWGNYKIEVVLNYSPPVAMVLSAMTRFSYNLSDLIVIQSQHVAEHEALREFKRKMRTASSYWGEPDRFFIKTPINLRENVVGFIGRFYTEKGINQLAEAIPIIVNANPTIKFILIGKGPCEDQVRQILTKARVTDQVELVGEVDNKRIVDYLNKFKLFAIPSFSEGLPNVLLESFACGTPVLASAVGAIPEVIVEGQTGFLLKGNDPLEISQRILDIFKNPEEFELIVKNAKEVLEEKYSKAVSFSQFRQIFEELAKQ